MPAQATLWRDEAQRRYVAGNLKGALRALDEALRQAPDSAQLHFMSGNAFFRLGRYPKAIRAYEEAARLRPGHPDTFLSLGFARFYAGQIDPAVLAWEAAVRGSPQMPVARLALAVGYEKQAEPYFSGLQLLSALAYDSLCTSAANLRCDVRWRPDALAVLERIIGRPLPGSPDQRVEDSRR